MTPREALIAAKELIDTEDKWTQGQQEDPDGRHCVLGAIDAATQHLGRDQNIELYQSAGMILAAALPKSARFGDSPLGDLPLSDVAQYNDTRTYRSVMRVLDRAIEAAS